MTIRQSDIEASNEKNERNRRVSSRYDELMRVGKHGHYETMFRVVREEVEAERERCAKIAEDRATSDRELYQNETDWRPPYAFNRVVRASMDIAAAIRSVPAGQSDAQQSKERD